MFSSIAVLFFNKNLRSSPPFTPPISCLITRSNCFPSCNLNSLTQGLEVTFLDTEASIRVFRTRKMGIILDSMLAIATGVTMRLRTRFLYFGTSSVEAILSFCTSSLAPGLSDTASTVISPNPSCLLIAPCNLLPTCPNI